MIILRLLPVHMIIWTKDGSGPVLRNHRLKQMLTIFYTKYTISSKSNVFNVIRRGNQPKKNNKNTNLFHVTHGHQSKIGNMNNFIYFTSETQLLNPNNNSTSRATISYTVQSKPLSSKYNAVSNFFQSQLHKQELHFTM